MRKPTEFETEVYEAVRGIRKGETRTYAWVARKIGRPKAARAVGNALGRNPHVQEVPCHRVVKSDGTIGGYMRGVERKRTLLNQEASAAGKEAKW